MTAWIEYLRTWYIETIGYDCFDDGFDLAEVVEIYNEYNEILARLNA